jgi:hypothetical protein
MKPCQSQINQSTPQKKEKGGEEYTEQNGRTHEVQEENKRIT